MCLSWSIYHCHISWKWSFFDKKTLQIVNKKRFIIQPKYIHFDKIKSFWKLDMVHIDPFFVQIRSKNRNFRLFTLFFSELLEHSLLIPVESPNIFNWKSGALSESVKKGKCVTKSFYQVILNEILKEITRNKRSGGCI